MKLVQLLYGVVCYLVGLAVLSYAIVFVGGWYAPLDINTGIMDGGLRGYLVNAAFLGLFAIQHTIMARPGFKEMITKVIPSPVERSTFVLATSLILIGMIVNWHSYPALVWDFSDSPIGIALTCLSVFGFALGLYSSFQIDHFELFGLKQVISQFQEKEFKEPEFVTPWLYKLVRNPLMLGFLLGFWAAPAMSQGRLFFCIMVTGYIFVGIQFEERDIAKKLGRSYLEYKSRTPMVIPFLTRGS